MWAWCAADEVHHFECSEQLPCDLSMGVYSERLGKEFLQVFVQGVVVLTVADHSPQVLGLKALPQTCGSRMVFKHAWSCSFAYWACVVAHTLGY